MNRYDHLNLPVFKTDVEREKQGGGRGPEKPEKRRKDIYSQNTIRKTDKLISSFKKIKEKFSGKIDASLIYEIEINQSVSTRVIENQFLSMGIHILSIAENKKGYWVVFSDDHELVNFKRKLSDYGSETGPKYDFFNAIETIQDIPKEKKIGQLLKGKPLDKEQPEFINIELWKTDVPDQNNIFIKQLKRSYPFTSKFRITDTLITKSFVLLRVKLTGKIFDEIIELKEIARVDRPSTPVFNPFQYRNINISEMKIEKPDENAAGILVVDSGVVSNHPFLEHCIGGEENFQEKEQEIQDTVGHGTAVAGCAAYNDIELCIENKTFYPSNWIFSAKLMYAETNEITGVISARYDPEKLVEHQFKDAVESFLSNSEYNIRIVNISIGNLHEVWHKNFSRQFPFAALIDELAYTYPSVVFVVSAGNMSPLNVYDNIEDIVQNYPEFLYKNDQFKIINPATAAMAITVGSIAHKERQTPPRYGDDKIKKGIAQFNRPSPFSRTGPGINNMVKPELVDYGGSLVLQNSYGHIVEDMGGKIALLNNRITRDVVQFDCGTSFSAPKVANTAAQIANRFPEKSANFIKNMLLIGARDPFLPDKNFYNTKNNKQAETIHLSLCGYGISNYERAVHSFDSRVVLYDESQIGLNQVKVYSLNLPDIFFKEKGKKRIIVTLTFNPETRSSRGDYYLGNRLEFHMFHSLNPQILVEKYGVLQKKAEENYIPEDIKKFEIKLYPGIRTRSAGCHQRAVKNYAKPPKKMPTPPITIVLINVDKWIKDESRVQDYCLAVTFEHEKEIALYNAIKTNIRTRTRIRQKRV